MSLAQGNNTPTGPKIEPGSPEARLVSDLVGNPEDRFSQNEAQIIIKSSLYLDHYLPLSSCSCFLTRPSNFFRLLSYSSFIFRKSLSASGDLVKENFTEISQMDFSNPLLSGQFHLFQIFRSVGWHFSISFNFIENHYNKHWRP